MDTSKRRCSSRQRGKTNTHQKTKKHEWNRAEQKCVCVFYNRFRKFVQRFSIFFSSAGGEEGGGKRESIQNVSVFDGDSFVAESTLSPSSMVRGGSGWVGPKVVVFCLGVVVLPTFVRRVPPIISRPARNHSPLVPLASPHAINLIPCMCVRAPGVDPPREPGPANQPRPLISTDAKKPSQLGSHHPTIPIATHRLHRSRRQTSGMPILPRAQPLIHPSRFSFACVPSARCATRRVG